VFIAAIVLLVIGFLLYLGAFSQGPGPSMSDRPLQAWMFFGATACMVSGFLILVA
jgi:fumarate reductase subunit D